jgi:hypothetical protein
MSHDKYYLNVKFLGNRLTVIDANKDLTYDDVVKAIKSVVYILDPDSWDIAYVDQDESTVPLTRTTDMIKFRSLLLNKRVVEVIVNPNLNRCYDKVVDFFNVESDKGSLECKLS